ncbi:hypothetical protein [Streptomyces sp. cmx-18-6]|uniref:hypothetical protein n=1 Tax=Streptomyces sp. cmx-18-6 TaxID=2790930 RepID=UPI00397FDA8A
MDSGITDADGHDVPVAVTPGEAGPDPRVSVTLTPPAGEPVSWTGTPAAARELAAALVRAAEETENASAGGPVTVPAGELRRGDVRDGARAMTVEGVRSDGSTVHVTWKSGAGRNWTQGYAADAAITLRRRLSGSR